MIPKKYLSLFYFVLGFGLFMFTRLSNLFPSIGIAIIIAPIFILRFIRTQPAKRGIWLTILGFILSMNIALWGLFGFDELWMTIVFGTVRSTLLATIWFLPFIIDRKLYPLFQNSGLPATLIFPVITTAIFYITSLEGPFDDGAGTLSSFAYDYRSLSFSQIRSVFGIWIFVFIHSWLYSVVNYLWENKFVWKKIRSTVLAYAVVFIGIFAFGIIKTSSTDSNPETVKIAAAVILPKDGKVIPMSRYFEGKITLPYDETIKKIEDLTTKAANSEAKIVTFQEYSMIIHDKDERRLREDYKRIAIANNIYMSITYAYFAENEKGENKHLFISPKGEILLDYSKRYLLGIGSFGEVAVFKKGAEVIQSVETPYGKIGISICRDMGFPSYLIQAAKADVDIMLSPSYDWPKSSAPWYLTSTFENGFSFVRPTYNGYSYAADYHGNVISHMQSEESDDGIMYADVPVKGIEVLYPVIGDMLGWVSLIAILILIGLVIFGKSNNILDSNEKS